MLVTETMRQTSRASPGAGAGSGPPTQASAFNANLAPGHRRHLPQGRAARRAHPFHLHLRDLEHLHHRRDGLCLFHRPSAGDRARITGCKHNGAGWIAKTFLALVALVFPDLQLFNLVDDIVAGTAIPLALFAQTAVLGCVYTSVYFFFAWVVVSREGTMIRGVARRSASARFRRAARAARVTRSPRSIAALIFISAQLESRICANRSGSSAFSPRSAVFARSSRMCFSSRRMSPGSAPSGAACCCSSAKRPPCSRARFCSGTWRPGTWPGMRASPR